MLAPSNSGIRPFTSSPVASEADGARRTRSGARSGSSESGFSVLSKYGEIRVQRLLYASIDQRSRAGSFVREPEHAVGRGLRWIGARLPFLHAPLLDVLSLSEATCRRVQTGAPGQVISQVQSWADLSVLAQVSEILRIHPNAELRFEIGPAAAIRCVHGISNRLGPGSTSAVRRLRPDRRRQRLRG